jgi:hypothetical protein
VRPASSSRCRAHLFRDSPRDDRGETGRGRTTGRGTAEALAALNARASAGERFAVFVPARTDTGWWWHQFCAPPWEVRFLRGRVRFDRPTSGALFPSARVVTGSSAHAGFSHWKP